MRAIIIAGLFFSGCMFQHISTENKLKEAVHSYNDAVRWNRMDIAQGQVEPAEQAKFKARHARFGRGVSIANVELLSLQVSDERDQAVSHVRYDWIDQNTMLLSSSVVKQVWGGSFNSYALMNENIVEGDHRMFVEQKKKSKKGSEAKQAITSTGETQAKTQ